MLRLSFGLALLATAFYSGKSDCAVKDYDKVDCGFVGIDQYGCEAKGCCWSASSVSGIPWCYSQAGSYSTCFGYQRELQEPFSAAEVSTMRGYFLSNINIQGKGGIVAAPDYNTPGGSYYYHWMRDGALTMRCLQDTNPGNFSDIETTVKAYAQWVLNVQNEADPNGIDVRTEPKFNLPNGDVFTSGWCRPQNDGPGLRATALIIAAQSLIKNGESSYVSQYLWTGDNAKYNGGAIKYDLDYVVDYYSSNTCDLWEEIRDADLFWNRITMKKAMIVGAAFASQMGDSASASKYTAAGQAINATLDSVHFNGAFVQECSSRTRDSAVIVGFNDGFDSSDNMYSPTSLKVAKTVSSYNTMFCNEYAINPSDTAKAVPGILYGRYQGDSYAGGNPWVLSTAALASLFYRGASELITTNTVPSSDVLAVWKEAFNSAEDLPLDASSLAKVFAAQGDGVMLRLRAHIVNDNFHCQEQIDRNTGAQLSAHDLTWSYAEVLNAMYYRGLYVAKA